MKNIIIKFLNLERSEILSIDIFSEQNEVFAYIILKRKYIQCPKCNTVTNRIHDYNERTISHAILHGINTTIIYKQRRYHCHNCNKSFVEPNPFVNPKKRISKYTVLRIMKELKNPKYTFSMVAENCGISASTVMHVFDNSVGIPNKKLPTILCIDEVFAVKYKQRVYACVLLDWHTGQIYDLLPNRRKHYLAKHFTKIDKEIRDKVTYVSIDMWTPYKDFVTLYFRNAKICVDNFHITKLVNYAFDKVRIRIMNSYAHHTNEYYLLKKYNWLLKKKYDDIDNDKRITVHKKMAFFYSKHVIPRDLINVMLHIDSELEIAYTLKESFNDLNKAATSETIESYLDSFLNDLRIYNLPEFNNVITSFTKWRQEIINSFDIVDDKRVSNGPIESVNSRIKLIKRNANGYTNFERFKKRILYSLNKDSFIKF